MTNIKIEYAGGSETGVLCSKPCPFGMKISAFPTTGEENKSITTVGSISCKICPHYKGTKSAEVICNCSEVETPITDEQVLNDKALAYSLEQCKNGTIYNYNLSEVVQMAYRAGYRQKEAEVNSDANAKEGTEKLINGSSLLVKIPKDFNPRERREPNPNVPEKFEFFTDEEFKKLHDIIIKRFEESKEWEGQEEERFFSWCQDKSTTLTIHNGVVTIYDHYGDVDEIDLNTGKYRRVAWGL